MVYKPKEAKETFALPADKIFDGIIISIRDSTVKELVRELENWKGDPNSPAIELDVEVKHEEKSFSFNQLFTYNDVGGQTQYSPRSNLGKYKNKYGKLPEVGDQVKALTNSEGFLKLKLD